MGIRYESHVQPHSQQRNSSLTNTETNIENVLKKGENLHMQINTQVMPYTRLSFFCLH